METIETIKPTNTSAFNEQGRAFMRHLVHNDPVYINLKNKIKELSNRDDITSINKLDSAREKLSTMERITYSKLDTEKFLKNFNRELSVYKTDELIGKLIRMLTITRMMIKRTSYYHIMKTFTTCKDQLEMFNNAFTNIKSDVQILPKDVDVKNLIDNYNEICDNISRVTSIDASIIKTMKPSLIQEELKTKLETRYNIHVQRLERLKRELGKRKMEVMHAKKGYKDLNNANLSSLLYEICFRDGDMTNKKNINNFENALVYTNTGYVKNIAYKVVSNLGKINRYDDAVSCGLYGLTLAVQKYIQLLQEGNKPDIVFTVFAQKYVMGYIKSGMTDIGTCGVISTSTYNKIYRDRKNKVKNFNTLHKGIDQEDKEIMYDLYARDDNDTLMDNFMVDTETGMMTVNDNVETDNGLESITRSSELDPDKMSQARHYHELYMRTIKEIFNKRDEKGEKIFNRYDVRLFEMVYGFCFKLDSGTAKFKNEFIQSEIASELSRMYREEGMEKTFTQPAIVARTNKLEKKIIECIKNDPSLFKKLSVINKAYKEMPEYMEYLSNDRENQRTTFLSGELPVIDTSKLDEKTYNDIQRCKEANIDEAIKLREQVINFDDFFSPTPGYMSSIEEDITEIFNENAL